MRHSMRTWFVVFAVGNGIAAGTSLAAAIRGAWLASAASVAASLLFAGGMLRTIGSSESRAATQHWPFEAEEKSL